MTDVQDLPSHRMPHDCPVCTHDLVVTGLGCPDCGTGISGAFRQCEYCHLSDADLETLRTFLLSRGNMRELATYLGVSYPTARQRFADLLGRLGFEDRVPAGPPDREQVLAELAAGRISVDDAETLLTAGGHPSSGTTSETTSGPTSERTDSS